VDAIEEFIADCLEVGAGGGPNLVTLTAIPPDKDNGTCTRTFDDAAKAAGWAADRNAEGMGVYFHAAEPKRSQSKRLAEKDLARLWQLFADVAPPANMRQGPKSLDDWRSNAERQARANEVGIWVHVLITGGGLCVIAPLSSRWTAPTRTGWTRRSSSIAAFMSYSTGWARSTARTALRISCGCPVR
jgi:hypothetical protein